MAIFKAFDHLFRKLGDKGTQYYRYLSSIQIRLFLRAEISDPFSSHKTDTFFCTVRPHDFIYSMAYKCLLANQFLGGA